MKDEEERNTLLPETLEDLKGKTVEELRQMVDVLDAHLKSIHQTDNGELRDLSSDEQKAFDLGLEMREIAIKKIEEHVRISDIFRRRPDSVERVYNNIRKGLNNDAGDVVRLTVPEARDRALRVLDGHDNSANLDDAQLRKVEKEIRRNTDIARRVIVTENDAYREAWMKMVTQNDAGYLLSDEERDALRAWGEYRAMSEGTAASGGYGIPVNVKAA